jgi:hypothetical protein
MREDDKDSSRSCPVGRYILLEQIDPNKHGLINRDDDREYPL